MKNEELERLLSDVGQLHSAAWSNEDGSVEAQSGGFDADVPCAVAAICHAQLADLGALLGMGETRDFVVTAEKTNLYVMRREQGVLVALGAHDEKPTKTVDEVGRVLAS